MRRSFDPAFFPDPEGMAAQVKELTGAEMMVSLWPSVENLSENCVTLQTNGWLVATRDGPGVTDSFAGVYTRLVDSTNPGAREFLCEWFRRGVFCPVMTTATGTVLTPTRFARETAERQLLLQGNT